MKSVYRYQIYNLGTIWNIKLVLGALGVHPWCPWDGGKILQSYKETNKWSSPIRQSWQLWSFGNEKQAVSMDLEQKVGEKRAH